MGVESAEIMQGERHNKRVTECYAPFKGLGIAIKQEIEKCGMIKDEH